ncbi:Ohr family peroxiredoxin [Gordonia sp. (in: high G+C Gram-positive bacteria)]|uniref:Ohr family peroxiredoxin n=1 Tax=Gordonia sp. (in: high G+C Gram-positive bacteria) TaxID=84139 RepID=UPI0039E666D7
MSVQVAYRVSSTATGGGRDGHVESEPGRIKLDLQPPVELGGSGDGANPEELFSAGYAACFLGALRLVAKNAGVTLPDDTSVTVTAGIGKDLADNGFGLVADIGVALPGLDQAKADELAAAAHAFCPYSKATKGNIEHTVTATV